MASTTWLTAMSELYGRPQGGGPRERRELARARDPHRPGLLSRRGIDRLSLGNAGPSGWRTGRGGVCTPPSLPRREPSACGRRRGCQLDSSCVADALRGWVRRLRLAGRGVSRPTSLGQTDRAGGGARCRWAAAGSRIRPHPGHSRRRARARSGGSAPTGERREPRGCATDVASAARRGHVHRALPARRSR